MAVTCPDESEEAAATTGKHAGEYSCRKLVLKMVYEEAKKKSNTFDTFDGPQGCVSVVKWNVNF